MKRFIFLLLLGSLSFLFYSCEKPNDNKTAEVISKRLPVILDTDANNEVDDQHAIAYLLMNGETFDVKGITVNTTYNGGNIDAQFEEAERIVTLCNLKNKIPLIKGANASFEKIGAYTSEDNFDGKAAVDFIIEEANKMRQEKLVVIAVGKLTNVALAVKKAPAIKEKIRLVWLGSNYPEPGEYNLENDIPAMNYLLAEDLPFEMVMVRYGKPSGTDAVKVTKEEAPKVMAGLGPTIEGSIVGRHGGTFNNFGTYSVNLFEHIEYYGDPPARALFDMAAVAIVKNASWATSKQMPAPIMVNKKWVEQPENKRQITIWENFNKKNIMTDFYQSMRVN